MNKNDWILIIALGLLILFSFTFLKHNDSIKYAYVYYENDLILKIDLNIDETYIVEGYNGPVKIRVENRKIKVEEENSPYNLCSKQGFISSTYESIVCLPNKITIQIQGSDLDTIAR